MPFGNLTIYFANLENDFILRFILWQFLRMTFLSVRFVCFNLKFATIIINMCNILLKFCSKKIFLTCRPVVFYSIILIFKSERQVFRCLLKYRPFCGEVNRCWRFVLSWWMYRITASNCKITHFGLK